MSCVIRSIRASRYLSRLVTKWNVFFQFINYCTHFQNMPLVSDYWTQMYNDDL